MSLQHDIMKIWTSSLTKTSILASRTFKSWRWNCTHTDGVMMGRRCDVFPSGAAFDVVGIAIMIPLNLVVN